MTAVEWYAEEFAEHLEETYGVKITSLSLLKKAKEMEKEQKIKFAEHCLDKALDLDIRTAFSNVEQYYNQIFKSE